MDIYDPNAWTQEYVRQNFNDCIQRLKEINARVMELYRAGDVNSTIVGTDRMLNGATMMQNTLAVDLKPFLAANSFSQGLVITCQMSGAPDAKRRQTALAAFRDAQDFSVSYNRELTKQLINALQAGRSFNNIRDELCPSYRDSVIRTLEQNIDRLNAVGDSLAQTSSAQTKRKRKRILLIAVLVIISLISTLTATKPRNSQSNKNTAQTSTVISEDVSEPPTERPTRRFRSNPTEAPSEMSAALNETQLLNYVVRDARAEVFTYGNGGYSHEIRLVYPEIIIDTVDTDDVNHEIAEKCDLTIERVEQDSASGNNVIRSLSYDYCAVDCVLSVFVMTDYVMGDSFSFQVFSFDLRNGSRLYSNEEIIAALSLDSDDMRSQLKDSIREHYQSKMPLPDSSYYDTCVQIMEKSLQEDTLTTAKYFLKDDALYAIVDLYQFAGPERMEEMIRVISL